MSRIVVLVVFAMCIRSVSAQVSTSNSGRIDNITTDFSFSMNDGQYNRPLIRTGWSSGIGDYITFKHGGNNSNANTLGFRISDGKGYEFGMDDFSTNNVTISKSGRIGIGTGTPNFSLEVDGSGIGILGYNTSEFFRFVEQFHQGSFINYDGAQNVFNIGVHSTPDTNQSNDKVVLSIPRENGFVGINTSSPEFLFQVNEGEIGIKGYNTSRYVRFTEINHQGAYLNYDGSTNIMNIGVHQANNTNASDDLHVISIPRASGNVGIGTTIPDAKLAVKGNIHAEEVKVDLSVPGPDYVFKADYDLRTLEEIQRHIDEHGHLPNIPSAKEMETEGVELGVMNMKLLEKIEELTLHLIEKDTQLKELTVRLENLENSNCNK